MKVLLCGGGTAGHVNPAIAIADFIRARHGQADIRFVGTDYGIESKLVPRAGYPLIEMDVHGLKRRLTVDNIKNLAKALGAIRVSKRLLREFEESSTDENQSKRKGFWDKVKDAFSEK